MSGRGAGGYTGTGALVRLALRRDRIMLPVWLGAFVLSAAGSAGATVGLYADAGPRIQAAQAINHTQSLVALYGRIYDPASLGALAMVKAGSLGSVAVALLAVLIVVRHTRAEEETGRLELLGATAVGRRAPLTAAFVLSAGTSGALAVVTAASLVAAGLPAAGSLAFGLAWAGVGLAFAAVAGVTAQLTRTGRAATGLALAVLGVVYVLRAIGDTAGATGPGWLTWLSPIGWGQQFRPYAGNRWWVLLITLGFTAVVGAAGYALAARRDAGAGLLADRPGRASAGATLGTPLGLAWRLHRATLAAWAIGVTLSALLFGNVATNLSGFAGSSQARDLFGRLGGGQQALTQAYLAAVIGIYGVLVSAYGIQAAARLRTEEVSTRTEAVLATATGRRSWLLAHATVALLGTALLLALTGAAAAVGYGAGAGGLSQGWPVLAAALAHVPAAWVLTGLVLALYGLAPRLVTLAWAGYAGFVLLGELGPLLRLRQAVLDVSPFTHSPRGPGVPIAAVPLLWLLGVLAVLVGAGLVGFTRRDVPVS